MIKFLLDLFSEIILEGSIELLPNKRIPMIFRVILFIVISVFIVLTSFVLFYIAITDRSMPIIARALFLILAIMLAWYYQTIVKSLWKK